MNEKIEDTDQNKNQRAKLIEAVKRNGVSNKEILNAMLKVPRHLFCPETLRKYAYDDAPLPIERNQTISQPSTVAIQIMLLAPQKGEKVLEIGTGSGYQTAILAEMGMNIFTIEIYKHLYEGAKKLIGGLGYSNISFLYADGRLGWTDKSPFDRIIISAAPHSPPENLLKQLKIGGKMVLPVGDSMGQTMTLIEKIEENRFRTSYHGAFSFVPLLSGLFL